MRKILFLTLFVLTISVNAQLEKQYPWTIIQPSPYGISNSGVTTVSLRATTSTGTNVTAVNISGTSLTYTSATITNVNANNISASSITAISLRVSDSAYLDTATVGVLKATTATITNLNATTITNDSINSRVIKADSIIVNNDLTVTGDATLGNSADVSSTDLGTSFIKDSSIVYDKSITKVDDDSISYSGIKGGWGIVTATSTAGANDESAFFTFDTDGTITLISNTSNVVTDNTDSKLCIKNLTGNAWSIRNRLGGARVLVIHLQYKQ